MGRRKPRAGIKSNIAKKAVVRPTAEPNQPAKGSIQERIAKLPTDPTDLSAEICAQAKALNGEGRAHYGGGCHVEAKAKYMDALRLLTSNLHMADSDLSLELMQENASELEFSIRANIAACDLSLKNYVHCIGVCNASIGVREAAFAEKGLPEQPRWDIKLDWLCKPRTSTPTILTKVLWRRALARSHLIVVYLKSDNCLSFSDEIDSDSTVQFYLSQERIALEELAALVNSASKNDPWQRATPPQQLADDLARLYGRVYGGREERHPALFDVHHDTNLATRAWQSGACMVHLPDQDAMLFCGGVEPRRPTAYDSALLLKHTEAERRGDQATMMETAVEIMARFPGKVSCTLIHLFDLKTHKWKQQPCKGNKGLFPQPRAEAVMKLIDPNTVVMLGGTMDKIGMTVQRDEFVWTLNLRTFTWNQCKTTGPNPYAYPRVEKYDPAAASSGYHKETNTIFVVINRSGSDRGTSYGSDDMPGDVYALNCTTWGWEIVQPINEFSKAYVPKGRTNAGCVVDGDFLYIHGGATPSGYYSTDILERFNMRTRTWSRLPLLGEYPYFLSEHFPCLYTYPFDPTKKKFIVCQGGYIPEVGSLAPNDNSADLAKCLGPRYQLLNKECKAPYHKWVFRLDLETLCWTKFRTLGAGEMPNNAQSFLCQRNDGTLVGGCGYGLLHNPDTNGMLDPEPLWHSFTLHLDDCGDFSRGVMEYGLMGTYITHVRSTLSDDHASSTPVTWKFDENFLRRRNSLAIEGCSYLSSDPFYFVPPGKGMECLEICDDKESADSLLGQVCMKIDRYFGPVHPRAAPYVFLRLLLDYEVEALNEQSAWAMAMREMCVRIKQYQELVKKRDGRCELVIPGFPKAYNSPLRMFSKEANIPIERIISAPEDCIVEFAPFVKKRRKEILAKIVQSKEKERVAMILNIKLTHISPPVWRRARVWSGASLFELSDRLIGPLFGWKRTSHAHAFRLPEWEEDGVWIGSSISSTGARSSVDAMHVPLLYGGEFVLKSKKVPCNSVLVEIGDHIEMVQDLGAYVHHTVTLEAIEPWQEDFAAFEVFEGEGTCPPEDTDMESYVRELNMLSSSTLGQRRKRGSKFWSTLHDTFLDNSHSLRFCPTIFDLERCCKVLRSRNAVSASNIEPSSRVTSGEPRAPAYLMTAALAPEKPLPALKCALCGLTAGLKQCSGCRKVHYCSVQHQRDHWKVHRADCKKR